MESHILNTYHQAHFCPIGHEIHRMKNNSLSSESSYIQSSPEYPQNSVPQSKHFVDNSSDNWDQNQMINITQTSHEAGWDYKSFQSEESDDLYNSDIIHSNLHHNTQIAEFNNTEDNSLVEGRDYDIIIVYPVNPDLVDDSSDDDGSTVDDSFNKHDEKEEDYINDDDRSYQEVNYEDQSRISHDGVDIDLGSPLLFDEYLSYNNNKENLRDTDSNAVQNVEERFKIINGNVNCQVIDPNTIDNTDILINESDLVVLPNIEGLKDYLLDDMTNTKFSPIHTSCLVPQSPVQNICIDNVEPGMRMNGDLTDLNLGNGEDRTESTNKSDANKRSKIWHTLPNLKSGQNRLKPEVLSSSSRSPVSRHRTCKSNLKLYSFSSDEENDSNIKKIIKKKISVKPSENLPLQSECHEKLSPPHSDSECCNEKSKGSIKLTIINKSKVIIHSEHLESNRDKNIDMYKNSIKEKTTSAENQIKELDKSNNIKEKTRPENENGKTTVVVNKQQVQMPPALQSKRKQKSFEEELREINECMLKVDNKKMVKKPLKKKKNEEILRKDTCSNKSSAIVSPKVLPDLPSTLSKNVVKCPITQTAPNGLPEKFNKTPVNDEQILLDPIKEAVRVHLTAKKRKTEAKWKREDDIVDNKLLKANNLQLQPLLMDAEMMKMANPEITPMPIEKTSSANYEKIILVNVGTSTDEKMFSYVETPVVETIRKATYSSVVSKSSTNLKNKKFDHNRYKNITTTLDSVKKKVETKIMNNSLFSSIQDVVMKIAPKEAEKRDETKKSLQDKGDCRSAKITVVREYDPKAKHGDDKVILHLDKHRHKPSLSNMVTQTDPPAEFAKLPILAPMPKERASLAVSRKRNYSDMSMSSDDSFSLIASRQVKQPKLEDRELKPKGDIAKSMIPPSRKSTASESSYSSSRSSSSSTSSKTSRESYKRDEMYHRKGYRSSASTSSRQSRESCSSYKRDRIHNRQGYSSYSSKRESNTPVEERRIVYVGRLEKDATKQTLRNQFSKFGRVIEVRLHSKEDGYRYGFVTYERARDAWSAVEASSTFPQYDVGFGGRRAFCRQSYADLDGLEVKYTENAYYGRAVPPPNQRHNDTSFEQMLFDMKKKISQKKNGKKS